MVRQEIMIGADPELFVRDLVTKKFVSGHDLIPGTKKAPFPVRGGAVQVDGVAVEFNIDPCTTKEQFIQRLGSVTAVLGKMVRLKDKNYRLEVTPVATFDQDYFDKLPDETKLLGCEPDFNAHTGRANPQPKTEEPFRTGAGHIHVGWTQGEDIHDPRWFAACRAMTAQIDCVLYVPSHSWDKDTKRRELYGKRGAFRPKHYGVEARSYSSAWVADPEVAEWIFGSTKKAAELVFEDYFLIQRDKMAQTFSKKSEFSKSELREYMGYLVDRGFEPLPKSCWED